MIRNYLKLTLRNLLKNSTYAVLNVTGLAAGLTCFAFIGLWVRDEWSFDRFNEKAERIFRIVATVTNQTETFEQAVTAVPMGPALKADFPEVEAFVRFDENDAVVKRGDRMFVEDGILLTDPSFFEVFSYHLTQGDPKTALSAPYNLVLTESMSKKYFGNENPLGQTLVLMLYDSTGKGVPYTVTGVMPDAPQNAHFTFQFLASFETLIASDRAEYTSLDAWGNNSYYTYILLNQKANPREFEKKLPQLYTKYLLPLNRKYGGDEKSSSSLFLLQALTDIYLTSHRRYEINPTGNQANLYIFGIIGLLILLLAAINYVNLSTARSVQRAKEVSIQKVMGATKNQLIAQHLIESVLTTIGALILSFCAIAAFMPQFNKFAGKNINFFEAPGLMAFISLTAILLGLLAGIYPAYLISAFTPVRMLKGAFSSSSRGIWLRKFLVVLQFTISVALIAGIFVVQRQMSFIQHKDLGYNKDALLTLKVNGDGDVMGGIEAFRNEVLQDAGIKSLTTSNSILVGGLGNNGSETVDHDGKLIQTSVFRLMVDYDYLSTMGMQLVAGRDFSRDFPTDSRTDSTQNYILNEAAIHTFGWKSPEQAIGKPFMMSGRKGQVVGIVKNFHFSSLKDHIEPVALMLRSQNFARIVLRIDMSKPQKVVSRVAQLWKKHFPTAFLEYDFVDKKLNKQYLAELRFSQIFLCFSIISIIIACLGLFGLILFATEQRTKEIGIRKVLGASVTGIVGLLAKDLLRLVLIAIVIATPVAYYFMQEWLADFAYRIELQWWMFALAGIIAVVIAFLTVSFQSVKAALANPVKSLRSE